MDNIDLTQMTLELLEKKFAEYEKNQKADYLYIDKYRKHNNKINLKKMAKTKKTKKTAETQQIPTLFEITSLNCVTLLTAIANSNLFSLLQYFHDLKITDFSSLLEHLQSLTPEDKDEKVEVYNKYFEYLRKPNEDNGTVSE